MSLDPKDFATKNALEDLTVDRANQALKDLKAAADRVQPTSWRDKMKFACGFIAKAGGEVDVWVDADGSLVLCLGAEYDGESCRVTLTSVEARVLAEHLIKAESFLP